MALLEVSGIELQFGLRKILSDTYLTCQTGSITGILVRNGSGKSCLLNIIYGTMAAQNKSVQFNKKTFTSAYKHPSLITYMPQFNFIPGYVKLKRIFSGFGTDYT